MRRPSSVLIQFPPPMLEQIDMVARLECRTRVDLVREALRRYIESFRRVELPIERKDGSGIN